MLMWQMRQIKGFLFLNKSSDQENEYSDSDKRIIVML